MNTRRKPSSLLLAYLVLGLLSQAVFGTVTPPPGPGISEFMAINKSSIQDSDGAHSAWIEVFNPGPRSVNLFNWSLTSDASNLTQWRFPNYTLTAGFYVVVFASGKDRAVSTNELHTNFKLPIAGG